MTSPTSISGKTDPVVRTIRLADVVEALGAGLRDFQDTSRYGLLFGGFAAAVGLAIVGALYAAGMPYFAYPMGAGFALVAPFIAAFLYEVSRRKERGIPLAMRDIATTVLGRSELRWLGFMTLFVLIMWMYQVRFLMAVFLGSSGIFGTLREFVNVLLTTSEGMWFLLVGNIVGAVLATILYSLSVVSFPLVLDRDVDFVTAMITSVRAVTMNPVPMLAFAVIIAALLLVSALPFFLGLLVTLPVLGHATWHLYRRVIAPEVAPASVPAAGAGAR